MSELWIPAVEVESALADAFLLQMLYVEQTESEPVAVYINSPGGEVNSGLMIYDAIADSSLTVNTVCTGLAASMAAIILAGGKRGHRYILKHSSRVFICFSQECFASPLATSS